MTEQTQQATEAARQFDFWLGEWQVAWGEGERGSNRISRILDDQVILEEFDGAPGTPLRGMSVSVYDPQTGRWKQTWVDNHGGYLDFVGEFRDGRMVLSRETRVEGQPAIQRMVWYNIAADAFDWDWQRSLDGGQSWETLWRLRYTRQAA